MITDFDRWNVTSSLTVVKQPRIHKTLFLYFMIVATKASKYEECNSELIVSKITDEATAIIPG